MALVLRGDLAGLSWGAALLNSRSAPGASCRLSAHVGLVLAALSQFVCGNDRWPTGMPAPASCISLLDPRHAWPSG